MKTTAGFTDILSVKLAIIYHGVTSRITDFLKYRYNLNLIFQCDRESPTAMNLMILAVYTSTGPIASSVQLDIYNALVHPLNTVKEKNQKKKNKKNETAGVQNVVPGGSQRDRVIEL